MCEIIRFTAGENAYDLGLVNEGTMEEIGSNKLMRQTRVVVPAPMRGPRHPETVYLSVTRYTAGNTYDRRSKS